LFVLAVFAAVAHAALPTPTTEAPITLLGEAALSLRLPLDEETHHALATRDHQGAIEGLRATDTQEFSGRQLADHHFLMAWSLLRSDQAAAAEKHLAHVEANTFVPADHRHLTVGEIHLARGDTHAAARSFEQIDPTNPVSARALLQLAAVHQKAGATKAAMEIYRSLGEREDPAEGGDIALWALVQKAGRSNPKAASWLRRLYTQYPLSEAGKEAAAALKHHHGGASAQDRGERSYRLMELGAWRSSVGMVAERLEHYKLPTPLGCRVRYAYGRSQFKRNHVTDAARILTAVGEQCQGVDDTLGPKALYIAGKSLERKKAWAAAAEVYAQIPERYPEHTMADDGYALGGIAWVEAGQPARAKALWSTQADAYPTGDMAGEGFWRLAWSAYQAGETEEAVNWATRMVAEVPIHTDPVHVIGAKYWAARWRIYPDVESPETLNLDEEAISQGTVALAQLIREHPMSFYAIHAENRLRDVAPEVLAAIPVTRPIAPATTWSVRQVFAEHPATQRGLALARLGLASEAWAEFKQLGRAVTPSEKALIASIANHADPVRSFDDLQHFLLKHPPSTLGPDRDRILAVAFPDRYWALIQEVSVDFDYDPRIFHSLVREESSFNKDIRSWAGAKGLSQLMPATARRVASWLGRSVSSATINDPELNLAIGSRYLHYLFDHFDNNAFLAVAGYNAGEGNVGKWVTRFGHIPSDEFVEHIPFRETRHYVKRVLGTYRTYTVLNGPMQSGSDWSRTNHSILPSER
jgi:soluble lytic murein transglycosylase